MGKTTVASAIAESNLIIVHFEGTFFLMSRLCFSEFELPIFINLKQMDIQDAKLILTITTRLSLGSPDLSWV